MSPIDQLLMSPTWKHHREESNLSPFKKKDYDELTNKAKKNNKNKTSNRKKYKESYDA